MIKSMIAIFWCCWPIRKYNYNYLQCFDEAVSIPKEFCMMLYLSFSNFFICFKVVNFNSWSILIDFDIFLTYKRQFQSRFIQEHEPAYTAGQKSFYSENTKHKLRKKIKALQILLRLLCIRLVFKIRRQKHWRAMDLNI